MSERTEEQIITMEPLKVSIGGQIKGLPILRAGKSSEWKREWGKAILEYQGKISKPAELKALESSNEDVSAASLAMIEELLIGGQEKVLALVCSYADKAGGEITGAMILKEAWDTEVKVIWEQIFEEMFSPLSTSLPNAMTPKKK